MTQTGGVAGPRSPSRSFLAPLGLRLLASRGPRGMPAMRPEVTETRSPWRRSGSHWGDVRIGRRHRAVGALEERSLGLGGSRARREAGAGSSAKAAKIRPLRCPVSLPRCRAGRRPRSLHLVLSCLVPAPPAGAGRAGRASACAPGHHRTGPPHTLHLNKLLP